MVSELRVGVGFQKEVGENEENRGAEERVEKQNEKSLQEGF
jgi:hypothetical protein